METPAAGGAGRESCRHACIDSTIRSTAELGYGVTLVTHAIATFSQAEIDATVQLNAPSYARTRTSTAELMRALTPGTERL